MAARHVLVKNLATIETLGCMSVLCSDKTGTLTEGNMVGLPVIPNVVEKRILILCQSVRGIAVSDAEYSLDADDASEKFFVPELSISLRTSSPFSQLSLISRLCNGAKFEGNTIASVPQRVINGDPTDTAVLRFAEESLHKCLSLDDTADMLALLSDDYKKIFEIPFNSRNKWMMSVVQDHTKLDSTRAWMLIKGAPDVLFPSATSIVNSNGKSVPFNSAHQNRLSQLQHKWSSEGQRVIAVCKRSLDILKLPKDENELEEMLYDELEDAELTLVGLISIRDPPRADVKDVVEIIRAAGVRIFMITGDFMITAVAIAKQVLIAQFPLRVGSHTYKSFFRSESLHKIGMIPFIAFRGQRALALETNQRCLRRPRKKIYRFPCRCAKLLR
jgi:sodium/potassium-transporting ATPase subunit alpha